jgi:hypothetical protein
MTYAVMEHAEGTREWVGVEPTHALAVFALARLRAAFPRVTFSIEEIPGPGMIWSTRCQRWW